MARPLYHKITRPAPRVEKYLGELEAEIMAILWARGEATVHDVVAALADRHPVAYTTAMTVMSRLVEKGLLTRALQGRSYVYRPAMSREEFFAWVSGRIVQDLIADFGDVAIAQFLQAIETIDPARLQALRRLAGDRE